MKISFFEDASNDFFENSKMFDSSINKDSEKYKLYSGLYNLVEGLKDLQEKVNDLNIQIEFLERKINKISRID